MPGPEILPGLRVVASPLSLDTAAWPREAMVLRLASDEVLILGTTDVTVEDPSALVEAEDGFCGMEMTRDRLENWMARQAEWEMPTGRAFQAQGMAAGLPVKVWVDGARALLVTRASLSDELEARL